MQTTITTKGQVVIPAEIRRRLGITKGTKFCVAEKDGAIILQPLNGAYFEKVCGILKGSGMLKALKKDREEELKHEERKFGRFKGSR